MCKKLKFDHADKWKILQPESVQENQTDEIICAFGIQTDHQIPARPLDCVN